MSAVGPQRLALGGLAKVRAKGGGLAVASSGKAAAAATAAAAAVDDDNRDEVRESLVTERESSVHARDASALPQHTQPTRVVVVSTGTSEVPQADIRKML